MKEPTRTHEAKRERTGRPLPPLLSWVSQNTALAAIYFVAGKLALLMAITPGYPTAIWPAAGLALAGTLILGHRVWPGIWLGALLVNISSVDTSHAAELTDSLLIATSIATGATLQAVAGAWAVRRFVGYPTLLHNERDVGIFLLIAGPAGCTIGATCEAITLCASDVIPVTDLWFTWFARWVGNAIGAILVVPIVLTIAGEPRRIWRQRRIAMALPLAGLFIAAVVSYVYMTGQEHRGQKLQFDRRVETLSQAVKHALDQHVDVLHSIERLYASSDHVTRHEFATFVQTSFERTPGIQALEWIPYVPHERRAEFEALAQSDGVEEFTITERREQGEMMRADRRDSYFPVYYVEPLRGNRSAMGFDLASDPRRLKALQRSRDTGQPVATARVTLVQETSQQFGTLVFVPVYNSDSPPKTVPKRRRTLRGFALGVYRIGDLLTGALDGLDSASEGLELRLADSSDSPVDELLASSGVAPSITEELMDASCHDLELSSARTYSIGGRSWTLRIEPTPQYLAKNRNWSAWAYLAVVLFATGIFGTFLLVVTGRTFQIEQVVAERTHALDRTNQELLQKNEALDEFTRVASHDLQEPLRKLTSFSSLLRGDLGDGMPEAAERDLGFIEDASERMQTLVMDLLSLSRTNREEMRVTWIPLDSCVDRALAFLHVSIKELDAEVVRVPLPEVAGDKTLITQLYMNLIGNALKFTDGHRPKVALTVEIKGGKHVLGVKDNGIGIQHEYQDSIFAPFRRLHGKGKYKGSGIGLAICRRAVERHEGKIWVESEIGQGAHFKFTLEPTENEEIIQWRASKEEHLSSSSSMMTPAIKS